MAYRVMIYRASCAAASARAASPLIPLADLDRVAGDAAGDPEAVPVAVATTAVPVALVDLLATRHVVAVFDHAERCVAGGAIGGDLQRDNDGRPTNLFFGLVGTEGEGYGGVGWFLAQPDGTMTSTIFLAWEPGDQTAGRGAREGTWPVPVQEPRSPQPPAEDVTTTGGRGGFTDAMEIVAGVATVVAIAAAGTLAAREWGEWSLLWRAALGVILATPVGHGVAVLVLSPVFMLLVSTRLWPFPPGASAYNVGSLVRVLSGLWCCRLLGDSFGWF